MPLYEYRCNACGEKVEMLVGSGTKTANLACPECGKKQLEKQLSTFSAHGAAHGFSGSATSSVGEPCAAPGCPRQSGFT